LKNETTSNFVEKKLLSKEKLYTRLEEKKINI